MSTRIDSSGGVNPMLASMLAQLTGTGSPPADAASIAAKAPSSSTVGAGNAVTGSGKARLSGEILDLLTKMHQASATKAAGGGSAGSSSASTTTISSASTMADPLDTMLSTLDTDQEAMLSQSDDTEPDLQAFLAYTDRPSSSG